MLSSYLKLRNWNILSKIVGVNLVILLVAFLAINFYVIPLYEQNIHEVHKEYTSSLVASAISVLDHLNTKVLRKEITIEQAQQSAITMIKVMANRNDYLWVHDLNLVMVAHPFAPYLEGKNIADFKDPAGRHIFVEMNQIARSSGSGFLSYLWPMPGQTVPLPKISHVKLFKPWGWVVGSGVYYDDMANAVASLRGKVVAVSSILFVAIIGFSLYAARRINQPLKQALLLTSQISDAHIKDMEELETSDEPRRLLRAIKTMVTELKDAKDAAERADRAKGDFLARMSHEIRTPMNAIVGMTELAMESATSLEQKEYLEGVCSSADHLTELINDILDFSKIEAGRLALEQIPFSLRDTINASAQALAFRARLKGLFFKVQVSQGVPDLIMGDPVRLRQIITNLASNATKFTSQGGVTISVEEISREGATVMLAISVCDTGIGISREAQEHIFDPFVQADSSTTRKFGGTGLGLAIVRQLVDMMGGNISVVSAPGNGSEFRITAPFRMGAGQEEFPRKSIQADLPETDSPPAIRRTLSVLLADDAELNQVIVTRFLVKLGHCAAVVKNGREAVNAWCDGAYDLLLMDVQMPEMDGLEATRAIRLHEQSRGGHIPIIAMTAYVMSEEVSLCLEAGMDGHLNKPLKLKELENELERIQAAGLFDRPV